MSDPGTSYRDRSEIQEVREKKDCLHNFKKLILDSNLAKEEELKAIEVYRKCNTNFYVFSVRVDQM